MEYAAITAYSFAARRGFLRRGKYIARFAARIILLYGATVAPREYTDWKTITKKRRRNCA